MEDNKIAISRLVAGEEVQEDVAEAERVEEYASDDAPLCSAVAWAEVSVECIHEWCVKEQ